jgi:O-antigen/teichoic acid export membrane protein
MAPAARTRRGVTARTEPTHTETALSAQDIGRRAASGAAMLTAKGALQQVLGFASTIVVTRLLLPDEVGVVAIAASISAFLWMLGGGQGMAGALIRRSTAPEPADLRTYVALQLGIMTVLAGVVAVATLPFGLVGQVTAVMVAAAPITAFRGPGLVVLERQLQYQRLTTAETAEMLAYYGWTVLTVAIGWGVWGLATATVVRSVVGTSFIMALAPTRIVWPRFDRRRARALLGIGARVQAVELVGALRDQVTLLATAAIASLSVVAYWSIVLRILQAPQMLLTALLRVTFPAMSRLRASGGDPGQALRRLLPATTILTGTILVPLAGAAPVLVPLLLGDRWTPAATALPIACLALVIHQPLVIGGLSYLWTIGDATSPLRATIAESIIFAIVGLPLVPLLGVLGLGIGLVVSVAVNSVFLARAIGRHAHIHVFRLIRVPVLVWVVAAGASWACAVGPGPSVVKAAVSVFVAVVLYLGLLILIRRDLMGDLAQELPPRIRRYVLREKSVPLPAAAN